MRQSQRRAILPRMKSCLSVLIMAVLLAACAGPGSGKNQAKTITSPRLLVLDVRTPQEFKSGHVKGAVNVPLDELAARIGLVAPDKDTPIAVHCQSGGRATRAKKLLDSEGYTHVENLGSLAHAREVIEGGNP
jgi:phage shock protein E